MDYFTKVKKIVLDSLVFFLENIEQRFVKIENVVNDLNSSDIDKPLSSNMGKNLADRISNIGSKIGDLGNLHSEFQRPSNIVLALNKVLDFLAEKSNVSHADPTGSNGMADVDKYGHVLLSDDLDMNYVPGKAASTHSVKKINDKIDELSIKKVLWTGNDGGNFMNGLQSITLSQPLSKQTHGIVLCWSGYDLNTNKPTNTDWWYTFIPKWHNDGVGVHCTYTGHWNNIAKYVYVGDTTIKGHEFNDKVRTVGGVTMNNNKCALRHVWGV